MAGLVRVWICFCGHVNPGHVAYCQKCQGWWQTYTDRHEDRQRQPRRPKKNKAEVQG